MQYIVVGYEEITHTDPGGWQQFIESSDLHVFIDAWMAAHPGGFVKVMTYQTFARTIYGKRVLNVA